LICEIVKKHAFVNTSLSQNWRFMS